MTTVLLVDPLAERISRFAAEHLLKAELLVSVPAVLVLVKPVIQTLIIPPIATVKATSRIAAIIALIPFIKYNLFFGAYKYLGFINTFFLNIMNMAEEKIITINLRKEIVKTPRWKRSKRAIKVLREVLGKNFKTENLKIDKKLNEKIWEKTGTNIPAKIRIKIVKVDDKTSKAELMEK